MSGYTLASGHAEQLTTRSCPICCRRYAATAVSHHLWLSAVHCIHAAHTETYFAIVARINAWADQYSSLTGEYVAAHLDDLPADCHLPVQRGTS